MHDHAPVEETEVDSLTELVPQRPDERRCRISSVSRMSVHRSEGKAEDKDSCGVPLQVLPCLQGSEIPERGALWDAGSLGSSAETQTVPSQVQQVTHAGHGPDRIRGLSLLVRFWHQTSFAGSF